MLMYICIIYFKVSCSDDPVKFHIFTTTQSFNKLCFEYRCIYWVKRADSGTCVLHLQGHRTIEKLFPLHGNVLPYPPSLCILQLQLIVEVCLNKSLATINEIILMRSISLPDLFQDMSNYISSCVSKGVTFIGGYIGSQAWVGS